MPTPTRPVPPDGKKPRLIDDPLAQLIDEFSDEVEEAPPQTEEGPPDAEHVPVQDTPPPETS